MSDAVKCLLITSHYRPLVGGAQAVYDALARKAGGRISVLTGLSDPATGEPVEGAAEFDAAAGYRIRRLPEMRPPLLGDRPGLLARLTSHLKAWRIRRAVWAALEAEARETKASAVCIGALDSHGWLVLQLQQKLKLPVVLFTHGEEISQAPYSGRADRRRQAALLAADAVIAVSRFTAQLIENKYKVPANRIHLLTNGVDFERFSAPQKAGFRAEFGPGPLVVSLGRLVRRKGFDRLLDAWQTVRETVAGATLAIAGTGPLMAELKNRADPSVHLLGRVGDDELPALMQAADLFAMPNRTMPDGDTEGFGLVFLEAAAAGTPSVAGRAGGAPDAVLDGETGLLVDGENPDEIAAAIVRVLTDQPLSDRLSAAAQAHARAEDWQMKAQAFLSICESVGRTDGD